MNRNILFGIVVLALVVAGIMYLAPADTRLPDANVQESTQASSTTESKPSVPSTKPAAKPAPTKTFRSLFAQSGNHQCDYEQVTPTSRTSGVIYVADGMMRGEFRTTGDTQSANLMIYREGILYTWKEGATIGMKSSITSLSQLPMAIPSDLTSGAVLGTNTNNVGWNCHSWARDTKVFVVPAYLKF